MAHHALSSQESYNPNHLLDVLLGKMQLKNDAALSRMLEVAPPVISKIRHHRLPVSASVLMRMHEVTNISIDDLRYLMGIVETNIACLMLKVSQSKATLRTLRQVSSS